MLCLQHFLVMLPKTDWDSTPWGPRSLNVGSACAVSSHICERSGCEVMSLTFPWEAKRSLKETLKMSAHAQTSGSPTKSKAKRGNSSKHDGTLSTTPNRLARRFSFYQFFSRMIGIWFSLQPYLMAGENSWNKWQSCR